MVILATNPDFLCFLLFNFSLFASVETKSGFQADDAFGCQRYFPTQHCQQYAGEQKKQSPLDRASA
jgi:hypothetical protein